MSVEGEPGPRWIGPLAKACNVLRDLAHGDPTATVTITPRDGMLVINVRLKDGRSTTRNVTTPQALAPTLEALVALPPQVRPVVAATAVPSQTSPSTPAKRPVPGQTPTETRTVAPSREMPPAVGVEIGTSLSARIAGSQGYLSPSVSAFAELRARAWRFGMTARWDVVQFAPDVRAHGFEMETVAAGLFLARRWSLHALDMDVGMSPRLLSETQSVFVDHHEVTGSRSDIRLATFVRGVFGRPSWRPFVELDAELSPARVRRSMRLDPALPLLPAWSAGVGVGFLWEER